MADIPNEVSRRNVLIGTAAAAGALALPEVALAKAASRNVALASAGYADWSAQTGTYFTLETGTVLQLVQVRTLTTAGSRPQGVRSAPFLALFDVVRGNALAEGRYLAAHPTGGTFPLFLTKGSQRTRMVAVFN